MSYATRLSCAPLRLPANAYVYKLRSPVCLFGGKGKPGDIIEVQFLGSSLKALSQKEVHYGAYATSDQETDQLMALRNTYLNAIIRSYLNVRKKTVLQRAADWKKIKD
ncbi:unnamed protein product [Rhodiola kirilowii]